MRAIASEDRQSAPLPLPWRSEIHEAGTASDSRLIGALAEDPGKSVSCHSHIRHNWTQKERRARIGWGCDHEHGINRINAGVVLD